LFDILNLCSATSLRAQRSLWRHHHGRRPWHPGRRPCPCLQRLLCRSSPDAACSTPGDQVGKASWGQGQGQGQGSVGGGIGSGGSVGPSIAPHAHAPLPPAMHACRWWPISRQATPGGSTGRAGGGGVVPPPSQQPPRRRGTRGSSWPLWRSMMRPDARAGGGAGGGSVAGQGGCAGHAACFEFCMVAAWQALRACPPVCASRTCLRPQQQRPLYLDVSPNPPLLHHTQGPSSLTAAHSTSASAGTSATLHSSREGACR
jgi:hypothetical protein